MTKSRQLWTAGLPAIQKRLTTRQAEQQRVALSVPALAQPQAASGKPQGARTVSFGTLIPPKQPTLPEGAPVAVPKHKKGLSTTDRWPAELAFQCKAVGIPTPCVNWPFLKEQGRRFRLDLAYPDIKLCIEIDGGVHRIRDKFSRDLEKHRLLFEHGWRLLRVSPAEVNNGTALGYVERALSI